MLIIGYGNPGRADDGLGIAFAERIGKLKLKNVAIDCDYQLSVEHAYDIATNKLTILADAHVSCNEPFELKKVIPAGSVSFTTHSVSPEIIAHLAGQIAEEEKVVFIVGIRGYEFNTFRECLSENAKNNLKKAFEFFMSLLESGNHDKIRDKLESICKG